MSWNIKTFEQSIATEPNNYQYAFHLALEYMQKKEYEKAIPLFQKTIKLQNQKDSVSVLENYYALLNIAIAQKELDYSPEIFINSFCNAYLYRPTRAEPLFEISKYYIENKQFLLAYLVSSFAIRIPMTMDEQFVDIIVYEWGIFLNHFISCSKLGLKDESLKMLHRLLSNKNLPEFVSLEIIKHMPEYE